MKADPIIINQLNKVLGNELIAINQYLLHARMFKNWGLEKLDQKIFQQSLDEMKHVDSLVERILFLEGCPNLQELGKLTIGENLIEMLTSDLGLETEAVHDLRSAISISETAKDFVSRDLLTQILESEENHVDWLESQLQLIDRIGEHHYQQTMV